MLKFLSVSLALHAIPVGIFLMQADSQIEPQDIDEPEPEHLADIDPAAEALSGEAAFSITILDDSQAPVKAVKKVSKHHAHKAVEAQKPALDAVTETVAAVTPAEPMPAEVAPPAAPEVEQVAVVSPAPTTQAPTEEEQCPADPPGITSLAANSWAVDRGLVDYYATHIKELMKIAWVGSHKNEQGEPDGFRVVLRKCSILRNGGIKTADVVVDVGGVKVHSIWTAIGAYFKLRKQTVIPLLVQRDGQLVSLTYELR